MFTGATCVNDPLEQLMGLYDANEDGVIEKSEFEQFFADAVSNGPPWEYETDLSEADIAWIACQGAVTNTINDE